MLGRKINFKDAKFLNFMVFEYSRRSAMIIIMMLQYIIICEVPCATEYGQHWASSAVLFNLNENLLFSNFPSNVTLWQPEYRQTKGSC